MALTQRERGITTGRIKHEYTFLPTLSLTLNHLNSRCHQTGLVVHTEAQVTSHTLQRLVHSLLVTSQRHTVAVLQTQRIAGFLAGTSQIELGAAFHRVGVRVRTKYCLSRVRVDANTSSVSSTLSILVEPFSRAE